jgi:hypothetical protein
MKPTVEAPPPPLGDKLWKGINFYCGLLEGGGSITTIITYKKTAFPRGKYNKYVSKTIGP